MLYVKLFTAGLCFLTVFSAQAAQQSTCRALRDGRPAEALIYDSSRENEEWEMMNSGHVDKFTYGNVVVETMSGSRCLGEHCWTNRNIRAYLGSMIIETVRSHTGAAANTEDGKKFPPLKVTASDQNNPVPRTVTFYCSAN